jgi:hypothetical protein
VFISVVANRLDSPNPIACFIPAHSRLILIRDLRTQTDKNKRRRFDQSGGHSRETDKVCFVSTHTDIWVIRQPSFLPATSDVDSLIQSMLNLLLLSNQFPTHFRAGTLTEPANLPPPRNFSLQNNIFPGHPSHSWWHCFHSVITISFLRHKMSRPPPLFLLKYGRFGVACDAGMQPFTFCRPETPHTMLGPAELQCHTDTE